ncbi:MerR family transcriptional regulator [Paeniglutamicibacter sp.]|uniref:MerR family transcriptional regulator n=1 Tax=Paeniglutamicibacter sp. TaxID=1934391 RepID=UPI00398998AE
MAHLSGVTTKAASYYESRGLLEPCRKPNSYRVHDEGHLSAVTEIRDLPSTGIAARQVAP